MTIKNSTVTREQYDKLQTTLAVRDSEVKALRRESGKRRDWVVGLAVLSAVQGLVIWALILEVVIF